MSTRLKTTCKIQPIEILAYSARIRTAVVIETIFILMFSQMYRNRFFNYSFISFDTKLITYVNSLLITFERNAKYALENYIFFAIHMATKHICKQIANLNFVFACKFPSEQIQNWWQFFSQRFRFRFGFLGQASVQPSEMSIEYPVQNITGLVHSDVQYQIRNEI